jgi:hypothetical protein
MHQFEFNRDDHRTFFVVYWEGGSRTVVKSAAIACVAKRLLVPCHGFNRSGKKSSYKLGHDSFVTRVFDEFKNCGLPLEPRLLRLMTDAEFDRLESRIFQEEIRLVHQAFIPSSCTIEFQQRLLLDRR